MFSSSIMSSFFGSNTNNFPDQSWMNCNLHEHHLHQGHSDVFTHFSQLADRMFRSVAESFHGDSNMFPTTVNRRFNDVANARRHTVNNADRFRSYNDDTLRQFRHESDEPVSYVRSRLQWYDSNTLRALVPPPTATNRLQPSGCIKTEELAKLPITVFKIKNGNNSIHHQDSSDVCNNSITDLVPVLGQHLNDIENSTYRMYLHPESKKKTMVKIQPLQSSPGRGYPECEICLVEYRDLDRLRHLPCGHGFHIKCIDEWLKQSTTCPKCRAGVRTGLKRLERLQSQIRNNSKNDSQAPTQAIRHRPQNNHTQNDTIGRTYRKPNLTDGQSNKSESAVSHSKANEPSTSRKPNILNNNRPMRTSPRSSANTESGTKQIDKKLKSNVKINASSSQQTSSNHRHITEVDNSIVDPVLSLEEKSKIARKMAVEAAMRRLAESLAEKQLE